MREDHQLSGAGHPWYINALNGGSVQPPYDRTSRLELTVVAHGDIDILSGQLRVSSPHDFKSSPPLDSPATVGPWSVTSLVDGEGQACLLRVRRPGSTSVRWQRATTAGEPADLRISSVLVGDASLELTLGVGAAAERFPRAVAASRPDSDVQDRRRPAGDETRLLLPTSSVRSFRSVRRPSSCYDRRLRRSAPAEVWVGLDETAQACEFVVDLLAGRSGALYEEVDDAWTQWVDSVGGTFDRQASHLELVEESADLSQAFTRRFAEQFAASLVYLGEVSLGGEIVAVDPGTRRQPLRLPVIVQDGSYPSYAVVTDQADLLLLRLGHERPVRWLEAMHQDGPAFIPIRSGTYVLTDHQVVLQAENDESVAKELGGLCRMDLDTTALESVPGHGAAVNPYLGGDMPAWCYLGVGSTGTVSAVAVALVTDPVHGCRPASMDAERIRELVRSLRTADAEIVDDLEPEAGDLIASFESKGALSALERSMVYGLLDRLQGGQTW